MSDKIFKWTLRCAMCNIDAASYAFYKEEDWWMHVKAIEDRYVKRTQYSYCDECELYTRQILMGYTPMRGEAYEV